MAKKKEEAEELEIKEALPEAPASANVSVLIKGYDWQFTIRDHDADLLYKRAKKWTNRFITEGVEPKIWSKANSKASPKPKAEAKKEEPTEEPPDIIECPEHKVEMKLQEGKWGPFYSHPIGEGKWCNIKVEKARKESLI